jgi:uncharacterized membrane protein YdjX (TVP38/TMEM64 family)
MIRNSFTHILKTLRQSKAIQFGLVALFLGVGVFIMVYFDLSDAKVFIRAHRGQAVLISIVVYFLLGFTFIPTSPLTLFLAVFMGPWETVLVATLGNTIAALIEYQIGNTLGDIFDFEENVQNLPLGLGNLPMTSPHLLLAGRLLPIGKRGFSIVCGAYQVPLGKYLWTTVLMHIINASFIAFTSAGLLRFFQK